MQISCSNANIVDEERVGGGNLSHLARSLAAPHHHLERCEHPAGWGD